MIQFSLEQSTGLYTIRSYSPGAIQINDTIYSHPVIISSQVLIEPWRVTSADKLDISSLAEIDQLNPKIVLLGTGEEQHFPHPSVLAHFTQRRIGIEVMTTGAACRTFTALASEGREVVAALIL